MNISQTKGEFTEQVCHQNFKPFFSIMPQKIRIASDFRLLLSAVVIAVSMLFAQAASGRIFLVSNTADGTGVNTLRGAILAANANGGSNFILLMSGTYHLTLGGPRENAGYTGDLDVTRGDLTIIGSSASRVTISAVGLGDRVLQVLPNARLKLENIIVTGGTAPPARSLWLSGENGGGILNAGTLILKGCLITRNQSGQGVQGTGGYGGSSGGDGGGIYNSGTLVMDNSEISDNSCGIGTSGSLGASGGGIANSGSMMLSSCTINHNVAGKGGQANGQFIFGAKGGDGGGVYNLGTSRLTLCEIDGNMTGSGTDGAQWGVGNVYPGFPGGGGGPGGNGAGLYNSGNLMLVGCSIRGNACQNGGTGGPGFGFTGAGGYGGSGGSGGGVFNSSTLIVNNCNITDNTCGSGGAGGSGAYGGQGGAGGRGGAIFTSSGSTIIQPKNQFPLNSDGVAGPDGSGFNSAVQRNR
ncbi:hypothetical protein [Pedosphaera parvula]|uniref:Polymorphic outer membrane protein n=1 Tax=Pedosphaera parvula (strain Ellin514) TaxID=320771 RepID=B9XF48_PEDPL|nr:hypothetical protein [Pedosphaera parvula]EEF61546.1 hypothetical protein Cflav_PD4224 [Pedosphaera parvula Ellin514]